MSWLISRGVAYLSFDFMSDFLVFVDFRTPLAATEAAQPLVQYWPCREILLERLPSCATAVRKGFSKESLDGNSFSKCIYTSEDFEQPS